MNIHSMTLQTGSYLVAKDAEGAASEGRWAMAYGHRYQRHDGTEVRLVDLSIRSGSLGIDSPYTEYRYASLTISPDEARALAARLLDAADDADARSDEDLPITYDLTPKGKKVLV